MAGKYFEELEVGMIMRHSLGRTITDADNVLFTALTMNTQPLPLDEHFASKTQYVSRIVNGIFKMGLVVGITISGLAESKIISNPGYENVRHSAPVFPGDTIYVGTEVPGKPDSESRNCVGIVEVKHTGRNQDGVVVC